jgi:hypothetical protein
MDGTDGYSNQSGANAVSNMNLQNFLGVGLSGSEGSGFTLSIVVPVGFDTISFQYDFLTNELPSGNGAMQHQDFATFVLFNSSNALVASGGVTPANINFNDPARQLAVGPTATNPFFFDTGYLTFTKAGLAPGTYTVGFAVEDKTTSDIPSGLLVDNVQVLAAVPEASTVALAIAGAVLLVAVRLRTKRA